MLRPASEQDLPAIEAGMHDPDVVRWIGPPWPAAEVLARNGERWSQGSPTLAICELEGTCVGLVWMNVRKSDPSTGYLGYWLVPAARGRGLATSAVRLLAAWALRELPITNVRLTTAPDNERSQRVAERTGFRRVTRREGEAVDPAHRDDYVYELQDRPGRASTT